MPLCKDRSAKELNEKGYSLVRYPRSDISPLDVIAGEQSPLQWLGPLSQVWTGKQEVPVATESNVPNFTYQRSDEIKGSLGVRVLQGLIKNLGGDAGASVTVSSKLSFTFEAPRQFGVAPFKLGAYLKSGDLDVHNPFLARYLEVDSAIDTRLYIITEVLRARKLLVRLSGSTSSELSADVASLQGLLAGKVSVANQSSQSSELAFDGEQDVTFAFRAYELGYVDGAWVVVGAADRDNFLSGPTQAAARFGDRPVVVAG